LFHDASANVARLDLRRDRGQVQWAKTVDADLCPPPADCPVEHLQLSPWPPGGFQLIFDSAIYQVIDRQ
jgi:hypothetical protein